MIRDCGAKQVYFASYSPPLRHPCVYGIDMQTKKDFLAARLDQEEIRREIGADALIYQRVDDLKQAVRDCNPRLTRFEASCFDGEYITGDVTPAYLDRVERAREQPPAATDDGARSQLSLAIETAD